MYNVILWPDSVVDATSIAAFERRLDKHWANLDMKYVYDSNSPVVVKSDQSADFDIPSTDLDIQDHWGPSSSIHLCIYVSMYIYTWLYFSFARCRLGITGDVLTG